ncbi:sulfurtransferase [Alicyclobacillus fastidiosus]|uniref:Sulfurtransferase n=1 Tax=Alicyclobacillus fastidiosus TaxID=392011 RepID=A0ABV5ADM4_9BACL|nr:sulfurtransferase [Alicyclobacillus fastidiosus]WEH08671.1 sulfurtransferase [Alicyclobacillus fastidiosus]
MLITADELHQRLADAELVILDCRFRLSDPEWGQHVYAKSHIPGAYYLDLERDLSSSVHEHGGRHPLPDPEVFANKLGQVGVTSTSTVVVYDSGEGMATRAWWLTRYVGIEDVLVLDGGYQAWLDGGFACSTQIPPRVDHDYDADVHLGWTVDVDDVRRIVSGEWDAILIDARAHDRYSGEVEPIDAKAGHIPGAVNYPWQNGLMENGRWKPDYIQHRRFGDVVSKKQPIVVYCGSGVTACADIFALKLAGAEDVRLYAGSWSDWITYRDNPVEKA